MGKQYCTFIVDVRLVFDAFKENDPIDMIVDVLLAKIISKRQKKGTKHDKHLHYLIFFCAHEGHDGRKMIISYIS